MPLRGAVASGNWSNPAIWNGGVLPSSGDIVASNGFTVTIDQNINVDSITNAAATDPGIVPTMTSNTTPSGVVSASSELNSTYPAWRAFDKNNSTFWASSTSGPPQWLEYQFPSPTVVDRYILLATNTDAPVTWEFQAWNGSSWIVLQSIVNAPKVGTATTYNFTNTTAYTRYRMYMLAPFSQGYMAINELTLANSVALASATAGGGFILNSGVTVTCTTTGTITSVGTTLITYSGSGTSTLNANLIGGNNSNLPCVTFSGTGILNITGYVLVTNSSDGCPTILHSSTGILNFVGSVTTNTRSGSSGIFISGAGTLNYTGDVYSGTSSTGSIGIRVNGTSAVVNMTGNLIWQSSGGSFFNPLVSLVSNSFNLTGNVFGGFNNGIQSSSNSYLKVIGTITAGISAAAISSTSSGAINIFTGPFISHPTGIQPLYVTRMHYQRTLGSYYEFRDSSTNGALPPAGAAPATRLVSPDTVVDAPIPANVRQGVVYASGSQTGTMIVPSPSNVANNVPVDNTLGTAVLDPNAIWAVPLTSINTLNSIGRRVKNAATVETTGAQIQQTLNNNE